MRRTPMSEWRDHLKPTEINMSTEKGILIRHTDACPVNVLDWNACTCGLLKQMCIYGRAKFLDHAADCPCHCTCDFKTKLMTHLAGEVV